MRNQITESMLVGDEGAADTVTLENVLAPGVGGSCSPQLLWKPPMFTSHASKGKDKLDNVAKNLTTDPRPVNTAVRRCHNSSQSKMVEVTEI